MLINVTSRQFDLTPSIQSYADSVLTPLTEIATLKVTSVHATMTLEKNHFQVALVLNCKYHTLTSRAADFDLYKALDAAVAKLEVQCIALKNKIQEHRAVSISETDIKNIPVNRI